LISESALGDLSERGDVVEGVVSARVQVHFYRNIRFEKRRRILERLIAERVELGNGEHRGREPLKRLGKCRGRVRGWVVRLGEIVFPHRSVAVGIPERGICEPGIGNCPEPRVESGVKEKLQGQIRAVLVASALSNRCREASSGTDPAYRNAPDVYAKASSLAGKPTKGAIAVIESRRERVLRRKAVVGADDHAIDPPSEMHAAELFVIERA
jgi:hypothetical protein